MKTIKNYAIQTLIGSALALFSLQPALAQEKVIRVGVTMRLLNESGIAYGTMTRDELLAANAKGGVNGAKIEVILLDDECKPDKGVANVNRFIHQNKVHLILGSTCSSVTLPIVDVATKEQVPQVVPQSTNSSITQKGSDWVFRVAISERFYAAVHAKYVAENVGKKIAYLYTNDGAGIAFANQFKSYMKTTYNIDPLFEAQMQETDLDFRSQLLRIKSMNPDAIALGGQSDAMARQVQQSYEVGIPKRTVRVAASAAVNIPFPTLAGDAAEGAIFAAAFNCRDERPLAREFVAMVNQKFKVSCPDHDFSQAWDSVQIVKQALTKANLKLTDASLADDRRAIRDALTSIRYEGLAAGPIEFCPAPTPQCRDGNRTGILVQYTKGGKDFESKVLSRVGFDKDFGLPK